MLLVLVIIHHKKIQESPIKVLQKARATIKGKYEMSSAASQRSSAANCSRAVAAFVSNTSEPLLMEIYFTIAVMLKPLGTFQIRSVYRWCTTKVQKIYLQTAKLLDIFSIRERGAGGDKKIYNTLRVTIPYHQGIN